MPLLKSARPRAEQARDVLHGDVCMMGTRHYLLANNF